MLDQITYNRSQKQYEFTNPETGEIIAAPSGAANKAKLFRAVVEMLDPELFAIAMRIISRHPQLEREVWKGVELVAMNRVEVFDAPENGVLAKVEGSDEYGRYTIQNINGYIECQCQHWQSFEAPLTDSGRRVCKHIAAVTIEKLREDRY